MADAPDSQHGYDFEPAEVERLLEAAIRLPADERKAFLSSECQDEPALEAEVLSLVEHMEAADVFFERLDASVRRSLSELGEKVAGGENLGPDSRIGRYRILERIGAGGMGAVYRARDESLDRDVALKLIPSRLASDPAVRARFLVEARAAASLDHPNICTIHEVAETIDGRPFLAMTCYRGETLKDRLGRGPVPVTEALKLTLEIVRGLAAAHERGIVHRDVKPGNVMLVDDGSVKLLDFGIAKVADATVTGPDLTPGTVAYMSPEQARGNDVDHRTDLWSVGVVLYEMVAGRRPFSGEPDAAIIHSVLHTEPPPLEDLQPGVPETVVGIVRRLLRKDPAERYPHAAALDVDLERSLTTGTNDPTGRTSGADSRAGATEAGGAGAVRAFRRHWVPMAIVAAAVFAGLAATVSPWTDRGTAPEPDLSVVAVLPFRVSGADPALEYLRNGMLDLLAVKLNSTDWLSPVDPGTLLDAWQRAGGEEGNLDRNQALDLAGRLGAGRLLLGDLVSLTDRVVISASLYDVAKRTAGSPVAVEGPVDSLPALVDRLAVQLLSLEAGAREGVPFASVTTSSLPAFRLYLEGHTAYRRGQYDDATRRFSAAMDLDSTFALAALMTWRAGTRAGPGVAPRGAIDRAWRHRARLGPRERSYLNALFGPDYPDHASPARKLAARQQLVSDRPKDAEAWFRLGESIPHTAARTGTDPVTTMRRTVAAFRTSLALDSAFMPAVTQLQLALSALGDTAGAFGYARHYLSRVPDGLEADKLRCVLSATSGGAGDLAPLLDSLAPAALGRCLLDLHGFHPAASAARDSLAAYLDRRSDEPEFAVRNIPIMYRVAYDRGRPAEARRYGAAFLPNQGPTALPAALIRDALHWEGEHDAAEQAAAGLETWLRRVVPDDADAEQVRAACALAQWRVATARYRMAATLTRRLRTIGGASARSPLAVEAIHCAALVDAWAAIANGAVDVEARVAELDKLLTDGSGGRLIRESGLILARGFEAQGDPARALGALDRSHFARPGYYTSTHLRERGRLFVLVGDTAAAADAYRRYLAMRSSPEDALRPEVDNTRRGLGRLGG